jgi:hypothetical protein
VGGGLVEQWPSEPSVQGPGGSVGWGPFGPVLWGTFGPV